MAEMTKPQIKAAHKKAEKMKASKMKASMKKQYGAKKGEKIAYATATKQQLKNEVENKEKADLDNDGKLSSYEKKRGEAIEKAIKDKADKQAKDDMAARRGKDKKMDEQEHVENLQENEKEENKHPYPQLFQEKPRLMQDVFNKKEELVYQELIRRFLKK